MYHVRARSMECRDALIAGLRDASMQSVFHYVPLHTSPYGQRMGWSEGDLPVTERESTRLLRLPLYPELRGEDVDQVIDSMTTTASSQFVK
jgi:dTDP-4-amino-4,6-dideoxygalactose transaminase